MDDDMPEMVKAAEQLLAEVHMAVCSLPRESRYSYGLELRQRTIKLVSVATRAWREAPKRIALLDQFIRQLDDFKTWLRLGKAVRAFRSFRQFEALARAAESVGRQAGGWKKRLKSQNPEPQ